MPFTRSQVKKKSPLQNHPEEGDHDDENMKSPSQNHPGKDDHDDENMESSEEESLQKKAQDVGDQIAKAESLEKETLTRKNLYSNVSEKAQNVHEHFLKENQNLKGSSPRNYKNESKFKGTQLGPFMVNTVAINVSPKPTLKSRQSRKKEPLARKNLYSKVSEKAQNIYDHFLKDSIASYIWILFAIIILFICYFIYAFMIKASPHNLTAFERFNISLNQIKREFQDQEDKSWRVIFSAVRTNMQNNTFIERPAVILLISSIGAEDITSCLANRLAENIVSSLDITSMPDIISNPQDSRKEIHDKIVSSVRLSQAVVFKNLEKFSFKQVSILHGQCDDQEAPIKNSYFVLTLNSYKKFTASPSFKAFDQFAYNTFFSIWENISEDLIYPLLSRITPSVALIKEGVLPSFCHNIG